MEKQIDLDRHAPKDAAKVARKLVSAALAAGYLVSVYDGEEWTVRKSTDRAVILAALASTEMDTLRFRKPDGERVGVVSLIYGNDSEVVCDYTDSPDMVAFMKPIESYAEGLQS